MKRDEQAIRARGRNEEGFALILAMLSLLVLTFLGLTLATTTSTEMQIAANYRWSQQAYYAAEAGIEAGKIALRNIPTDWNTVLWTPPRGAWPAGTRPNPPGPSATPPTTSIPAATPDQWGNPSRSWEYQGCDSGGNVGFGVVLNDTASGALLLGQVPAGPYQNVSTFRGQQITGSFTLWVRRDVQPSGPNMQDDPSNLNIVLTSEGVAPARQAVGTTTAAAWQQAAKAVRVLSIKLTRGGGTSNPCERPGGQVGGAPSGANFQTCAVLQGSSLTAAFGGGTYTDTGVR